MNHRIDESNYKALDEVDDGKGVKNDDPSEGFRKSGDNGDEVSPPLDVDIPGFDPSQINEDVDDPEHRAFLDHVAKHGIGGDEDSSSPGQLFTDENDEPNDFIRSGDNIPADVRQKLREAVNNSTEFTPGKNSDDFLKPEAASLTRSIDDTEDSEGLDNDPESVDNMISYLKAIKEASLQDLEENDKP